MQNNNVNPESLQEGVEGESPAQEQYVPYSRFKEVNDQMKTYKEEMENLKQRLSPIEQKFSPAVQEEQIPDLYEDPKAYADWIKQNTIKEIKAQELAEKQARDAENARLDAQVNHLKQQYGDIDVELVEKHALKYNIRTDDLRGYDLIKAFENLQGISKAVEHGKDSALQQQARAKAAPVGTSKTTRTPAINLTQQDLTGLYKGGGLATYLASLYK